MSAGQQRLSDRVGHLPSIHAKYDTAVKTVMHPLPQRFGQPRLIEEGQIDRARVVGGRELGHRQPGARAPLGRLRVDLQYERTELPVLRLGDGADVPAVLIGAREKQQQVPNVAKPQTGERGRARFADAVQCMQRRLQRKLHIQSPSYIIISRL